MQSVVYKIYKRQLQSVGIKGFRLIMDILMLTWNLVRRIVLPGRGSKGNILSSLHDFYIGVVGQVAVFERGILHKPVIFDNRYVKKILVILSCFLFLLSSLEWMHARPGAQPIKNDQVSAVCTIEQQKQPGSSFHQGDGSIQCYFNWGLPPASVTRSSSLFEFKSLYLPSDPYGDKILHSRKWLLFRVFRI